MQLAAFCVLSTAGLRRSQERVEGFLDYMVSVALKGCGPASQKTPQPGVWMDPVLNERKTHGLDAAKTVRSALEATVQSMH